jgi:hypothetical protein
MYAWMVSLVVPAKERTYPDRITKRSRTGITPDSFPVASGSPISGAKPEILVTRATMSSPDGTQDHRKRLFPERYQPGTASARNVEDTIVTPVDPFSLPENFRYQSKPGYCNET